MLRAIEIEADVPSYLAKVQSTAVYDSDPKTNPDAKKYDEVSIQEVIDKKLRCGRYDGVHSCAWRTRCRCCVFGLNEENSIVEYRER